MTILIVVAVLAFLILVTALYVAAEFSAISSRRPRLSQMAEDGNVLAGYMLEIIDTPHLLDRYVAACQVGITVASLVLGFYGQSSIVAMLAPAIAHLDAGAQLLIRSVSATAILLSLTVLQVILGELIPKNVGLQYPEQLVIATAPAMRWSMRLFEPLIWLFNGSGQIVLRLMGSHPKGARDTEHIHSHSPDEIVTLVEESSAGGVLDAGERRLLLNTLHLRDLTVRKVMIPRNNMLTAPFASTCDALFTLLANSPYSRLPVYERSVDSIAGVIHLKDLLQIHINQKFKPAAEPACSPRSILHPVLHVPETADVGEMIILMQRKRCNLAIVVDEYGGTAGMVTFEDLVEEILGEFHDEFDVESPALELQPEERLRVRGNVLVADLYEMLDLDFTETDIDTIGGLVVSALGRSPHVGDVVDILGLPVRIERVAGNRVVSLSIPVTFSQADRVRDRMADL